MGSLANLFNLNLTTDLPSIQKTGGKYLGKLEIPAHSGRRTVTQTYNNVLGNGTPFILANIDGNGWRMVQDWSERGSYPIDVWVGSVHYTVGWWSMDWQVHISGKNVVATLSTSCTADAAQYNFPAMSMEVAFIEMSEPV